MEVKEFTVLGLHGDLVDFRCRVSSGTYVRSLAHELGQKLGIGANLASLRRTAWPSLPSNSAIRWTKSARLPLKAVSRSCWSIRGGCCRRFHRSPPRRRHRQDPPRPDREPAGNVPVAVREGVCRTGRADLHRQPSSGDAVPSESGFVQLRQFLPIPKLIVEVGDSLTGCGLAA